MFRVKYELHYIIYRMKSSDGKNVLVGTTLKVYRFIFRSGRPVGVRDVQRGLGLSSPSVALYHINKLVEAGLLREEDGGYVVDRRVFENMIRVRRMIIPFQAAYGSFFITTFLIFVTLLRPEEVTSTYVFALAVNFAAILISLYECFRALRRGI